MRKITEKEMSEVIVLHKKWINQEEAGKRADLRGLNLSGADLSGADLRGANLGGADFTRADLRRADLRYADLRGANLHGADLRGANLFLSNLNGADLTDVEYDESTAFFVLQCPSEGSFIAYKKAREYIVKLEVPSDAKRSSATSRKCRVSKAKVLSITSIDGKEEIEEIRSNYDFNFIYKVEEMVEVPDFDENRWNECSSGIHCFITRQESVLC